MTFKNLTLAVSILLGASAVQAAQLEPVSEIRKDASLIKNFAVLKDRELKDIQAEKNSLIRLMKTQKFDTQLQSDDERRAVARLTGKTPKIARMNSFDAFLQTLFGG